MHHPATCSQMPTDNVVLELDVKSDNVEETSVAEQPKPLKPEEQVLDFLSIDCQLTSVSVQVLSDTDATTPEPLMAVPAMGAPPELRLPPASPISAGPTSPTSRSPLRYCALILDSERFLLPHLVSTGHLQSFCGCAVV